MNKFLISLLVLGLCSCQLKQKQQKAVELPFKRKFDHKVSQLKEYRKYKDESDSLRYFGRRQEVYTRIFEKSTLPEDSLKNIALAYVIRDVYSSRIPLVLVKYDKDLDTIVEIQDLFKKLKDSVANSRKKLRR